MLFQNQSIYTFSIVNSFFGKFSYINPICRFISNILKPFGYDIAFCRYQSKISIYSIKADLELYKDIPKGAFINLGAGAFRHKKWVNYDYPGLTTYYKRLLGRVNKDYIPIDLNKDLNLIRENEIAACYLSHTLEHLPRESAIKLINYVYERLVPGGVIRIVVPDHEMFFLNNKINKNKFTDEKIFESIVHLVGQAEKLDKYELIEIFHESQSCDELYESLICKWPHLCSTVEDHPEFHLSLWSRKYINEIMNKYNFDQCFIVSQNCSSLKLFTNAAVFDTTEPQFSLYFEIVKNV